MKNCSRLASSALCRILGSIVLLGMTSVAAQAQLAAFTAVIQPTQEVPPILTSNAFGNALVTFDVPTSMLCYSITYSNGGVADLASGETVAHFHGPALPGVSTGVTFDISPLPSPLGSPKVGCVGPLSVTQRTELVNGQWYINIHSNDHPSGEIRGQVLFERIIPDPGP